MSNANQPSAWLRGPVEGILPQLQPVAHALIQSVEEAERDCLPLTVEELWRESSGAASVGFQLRHVAGATNRLFTYARGEELSDAQMAAAKQEKQPGTATAAELVAQLKSAVNEAMAHLRSTPESVLYLVREVGRAKQPSTTIGLLFHAAEHAQRHCGQISTTLKFLRNHSLET